MKMETVWRIDADRLMRWMLLLPTGALIITLLLTLLFNFEQSIMTHCKQVDFYLFITIAVIDFSSWVDNTVDART